MLDLPFPPPQDAIVANEGLVRPGFPAPKKMVVTSASWMGHTIPSKLPIPETCNASGVSGQPGFQQGFQQVIRWQQLWGLWLNRWIPAHSPFKTNIGWMTPPCLTNNFQHVNLTRGLWYVIVPLAVTTRPFQQVQVPPSFESWGFVVFMFFHETVENWVWVKFGCLDKSWVLPETL